ncbi:MAG: inositol-3-phosphate synthase [Bacteroidota bacterium]
MIERETSVSPAKGRLGILIVGMDGAVATTFMGGVFAVRKGLAKPIGSLTQLATIRLGKRTEHRFPLIRDFVPLANLKDLVFGGWDIRNENGYQAAERAGVLDQNHLNAIRTEMEALHPMKGVFDQYYVKRLTGKHVKKGKNKPTMSVELF